MSSIKNIGLFLVLSGGFRISRMYQILFIFNFYFMKTPLNIEISSFDKEFHCVMDKRINIIQS